MIFVVLGLVTAVVVALLVIWCALIWEKDRGGLEPDAQARIEEVQRRSALAGQRVWHRVAGALSGLTRAVRLRSKASTGAG